jgi:hypothetical protein
MSKISSFYGAHLIGSLHPVKKEEEPSSEMLCSNYKPTSDEVQKEEERFGTTCPS